MTQCSQAVGASDNDSGGAVFVFTISADGSTATFERQLTSPESTGSDRFGLTLATTDKAIITGAPLADAGEHSDAGFVFAFSLAPAERTLVVGDAYCASRGGPGAGRCIEEALADAELFSGLYGAVVIEPGETEGNVGLVGSSGNGETLI